MATALRSLKKSVDYGIHHCLDIIKPVPLPEREKPVYINFVIHTEEISNADIFHKFLDFLKGFVNATGVKCISCILTPECPMVKAQFFKYNLTDEVYGERVRQLALYADIGYHGHFFKTVPSRKEAELHSERLFKSKDVKGVCWQMPDGRWLLPRGHDDYDFSIAKKQILMEMNWFQAHRIRPQVYTAGSWLLKPELVSFIDELGFKIDCSIRKFHPDSFGSRYLMEEEIPPRGEVFILPPSKHLFEVQSIFYPIRHPHSLMKSYKDIVSYSPGKPLFFVFPSHERETIAFQREIFRNIEKLNSLGQFQWLSMQDFVHKVQEIENTNEFYRFRS